MPGSSLGEPPRAPTMNLLRLIFGTIGLLSVVFGYLGFEEYLPEHSPLDLLYYDLQLFVLGSPPLDDGGPIPDLLNIARFTAPAVTVYALVEAGRLLFATELRRLRARNSRNHVIVCGDGLVASTLARRLRAAGERVVTVPAEAVVAEPGVPHPGTAHTLTARAAAARDPDVLRTAGIRRARALYACTSDNATNTAIALAAAQRNRRTPLAVYAQVSDPELCLALQARHLGLAEHPGARLDFFNIDELAARNLFVRSALRPVRGGPPRVVVLGATVFGRAALVELARQWRMRDPGGDSLLPIALVDDEATRAAAELTHRYPFLSRVCHITPYDGGLAELLDTGFPLPPDQVFICYDDEEQALKTALTTEQLWHGGPGSVVVRLDRLASLREAFDVGHGDRVLDDLSGALRLYGVVHAACDPALIGDDLVERLARVIHESYVVARHRHGETSTANPALVPWDELPETLRQANRAQADDIGRKLRELGCALSPRVGPGAEHVLADHEIERLAVLEHQRWVTERVATGWRYADSRDDARRLHPALSTWESLDEDMRERNHDAIRELPAILADAGFRIVRVRHA
ncbi:hypothetical protein GCM10027280_54780 [Micromonospora polyrhachis]|uniref:RCK N-terminal domain-containing protein n=1 Tax=Micromonospora polyrhachis TaxID=1282883 RepID=A0A7W7WS03_9ACTN|nr:RyR domain-containing protein [Micromonospora polyrhachis]MBB4961801.1 hypothetical protein [Micromonospora polyrhachis]